MSDVNGGMLIVKDSNLVLFNLNWDVMFIHRMSCDLYGIVPVTSLSRQERQCITIFIVVFCSVSLFWLE